MWIVKLKFKNEEDKIKASRIVKYFFRSSDQEAEAMIDNGKISCIMIENASNIADRLSILENVDISIHYER